MADMVLTGVREMVDRLGVKKRQVRAAAAEGLHEFGERIMKMSKDNYVPHKTGDLRRSGQTGPPEFRGDTVTVELSYGGTAGGKYVGYAVYVHEIQARHQPPYGQGGQWKYLEAPMKLMGTQTGVDYFLAKPIREALEHGAAR